MTKAGLAEEMLQSFTSGLFEGDNTDRPLTEEELHAITTTYRVAKPYLSETFDRDWCEGVLSRIDFTNGAPAYEESLRELIGLLMGYIKAEK